MPPSPVLEKLEQIDSRLGTIEEKVTKVESDLEPVNRFYIQATGILAAIRWIGSGTVLVILAAVVWFMVPH